ncbi:hypothetical protein CYMTET_23533 [Cymbomonas tetramitiformis]|uniref:Uncharacterized protein n=1 Tax=Cymbomonas tetramitiformis TaxID=36881 RepID=A0AAE0FXS3_9CHLO|nr:hypothetical protein CYMTET_23533 [Cymbomonas tetramitiformis]
MSPGLDEDIATGFEKELEATRGTVQALNEATQRSLEILTDSVQGVRQQAEDTKEVCRELGGTVASMGRQQDEQRASIGAVQTRQEDHRAAIAAAENAIDKSRELHRAALAAVEKDLVGEGQQRQVAISSVEKEIQRCQEQHRASAAWTEKEMERCHEQCRQLKAEMAMNDTQQKRRLQEHKASHEAGQRMAIMELEAQLVEQKVTQEAAQQAWQDAQQTLINGLEQSLVSLRVQQEVDVAGATAARSKLVQQCETNRVTVAETALGVGRNKELIAQASAKIIDLQREITLKADASEVQLKLEMCSTVAEHAELKERLDEYEQKVEIMTRTSREDARLRDLAQRSAAAKSGAPGALFQTMNISDRDVSKRTSELLSRTEAAVSSNKTPGMAPAMVGSSAFFPYGSMYDVVPIIFPKRFNVLFCPSFEMPFYDHMCK